MTYGFNNDKSQDEVYSKSENNFGADHTMSLRADGYSSYIFPSDGYVKLRIKENGGVQVEIRGANDSSVNSANFTVNPDASPVVKEELFYVKKGTKIRAKALGGNNLASMTFYPFTV